MVVDKGLTKEQLDKIVNNMKEKCSKNKTKINDLSNNGQFNYYTAGKYLGEVGGVSFCMRLIKEALNDETRIDL